MLRYSTFNFTLHRFTILRITSLNIYVKADIFVLIDTNHWMLEQNL